jgi:hypothetical protein
MPSRTGLPRLDRFPAHALDDAGVLGVQDDHEVQARGLLHQRVERSVLELQTLLFKDGIDLQRAHALRLQRGEFGQAVAIDVGDDHVQAIVERDAGVGLLAPVTHAA